MKYGKNNYYLITHTNQYLQNMESISSRYVYGFHLIVTLGTVGISPHLLPIVFFDFINEKTNA